MAALPTGTRAPDFTLPTIDGGQFSLREALMQGPVVVGFLQNFLPGLPICVSFP